MGTLDKTCVQTLFQFGCQAIIKHILKLHAEDNILHVLLWMANISISWDQIMQANWEQGNIIEDMIIIQFILKHILVQMCSKLNVVSIIRLYCYPMAEWQHLVLVLMDR